MAQSDYELAAHVSGLNQRTEINSIFDSILTHNSGSTAPTVTKAFMMWVDTSNATYYYLKMRNHDNTAWVTLGIYTVATKTYTSYAEDTVKLTGNQTIAGVKTFTTSPVVPTPTTGTQAVNKDYADLKVALTDFTGANKSLGTSGYQKLPGGLIIQWGQISSTSGISPSNWVWTLPIAFPTTALQAFANFGNGLPEKGGLALTIEGFSNGHISGFASATDASTRVIRLFAIGY